MSVNYLVSVIVPIYKVEQYVSACIESIVNQTYKNIEIILINDGSPDNSLAICKKWEKKDARIKVIDQKNSGVSVARNSGIDACQGEWICFVDGDDFLENDAVEKMVDSVSDDIDVLLTDYFVDNEAGSRQESFFTLGNHDFKENDRIELIKNCYLWTSFANKKSIIMTGVPWSKLFRANLIKSNDIRFDADLRKMQDALFCSEVFQKSERIIYRKIYTYHYRQNVASITHRSNPGYKAIADSVLGALKEFIEKYGYEKELMPVYEARKFMFALETVKFVYVWDETGMPEKQRIQGVRELLQGIDINIRAKDVLPYLKGTNVVAYGLYRLKMYKTIYQMMSIRHK